MNDDYLVIGDREDEPFPIMTTTASRDEWLRDFILGCVPEIADDVDAGPTVIPGLTADAAAGRFLAALRAASRTDPLALEAWTEIVGLGPLAPEGHMPVRVRWARDWHFPAVASDGEGMPGFLANEDLAGVTAYVRSLGVVAAHQRSVAMGLRMIALFHRANAAGYETLPEAVAAGVLTQAGVDAAEDVINPPTISPETDQER